MYSTCLYCNTALGSNRAVEIFPVGRRLAFDSKRGRLWVVCASCERWNLTPIETRWEAVEACERFFRAARKRVTTEHVGLARLDEGLELVRIGKPLQEEFAAWRYGDQFGKRRRRAIAHGVTLAGATGAAFAGAVALGAAAGLAVATYHVSQALIHHKTSRQTIAYVPTADGDTVTVVRDGIGQARMKSDMTTETKWKLVLPHDRGTITLSGDWAVHALAMCMPTINGTGGSTHLVNRALKRLEAVHHVDHYLQSAAALSSHNSRPGDLGTIGGLPTDVRLAIEMAVNEQNERHALEGEIWLLEFAWEQAEVIAAIADNLLVPAEVQRKLADLKERRLRKPNS